MRICFVGDSLVNGTHDPQCLGWVGRACSAALAAGADLTSYNLGVRGDTSRKIFERIGHELSVRLPEGIWGGVVLSFGAADACLETDGPRLTTEQSVDFLRRILRQTSGRWPTLMVGPPPSVDAERNAGIAGIAAAYARACGQMRIPYLDFFSPLSGNTAYLEELARGDGVHPGAAGYDLMAGIFIGWQAWRGWF